MRPAFRRLAALEWRLWRADRTCWLVALAIALGATYAAGNGLVWSRATASAHETAHRENQERFSRLRAARADLERRGVRPDRFVESASPFLVGDFNPRYVAFEPRPLGFLAFGQSDVYPSYFRVTGERRDSFIDVEEIEHPLNLGNGRFDVAFFVAVILPMFLLVMSCTVVSAEREQGTLMLALSQPVSVARLLAARLTVRALLVLSSLGLVVLVALAFRRTALADARSLLGIALGGASVVLSVVWWLLVGAAISLRGWSSGTNAIVALGVWLATTVFAPIAIQGVASVQQPMPPRIAILERTRDLDTATRTEIPRLLDAYYAANPAERPPNLDIAVYDFALYWTITQREVDRQMTPLLAEFETALQRQQLLVSRLAWLSPPLALQEVLTDLAGTGARRHLDFMKQIVRFHDAHRAFFDTRTLRRESLTSADFERMPTFAFEEEAVWTSISRVRLPLLSLGLWVAVALAWMLRETSRLQVVGRRIPFSPFTRPRRPPVPPSRMSVE